MLPGVKPVLELLESDPGRVEAVFIRKGKRGREVDRIVELCREARVRFTFAEPHALDRLFASGQAIGQPIGQAATEPDMPEPAADDLFADDADDDDAWDILEGDGPDDGSDDAEDDATPSRVPRSSRPSHPSHPSRPSRPSHQGVIARVFDAGFADLGDILRDAPDAPLPLIVALDQVQDPGNVGTLARTLYALGAAGLVVVRHGGAALGGAAARAAAGALEKLPVAKVTNLARALDEADEAGYTVYAAGGAAGGAADGAAGGAGADRDGKPGSGPRNPFTEPLRTPAVLVLGNEDTGIRPNVAKRCHFTLAIPMARDFDSLNVAQAGAILVGCFAARRHKG
ncbi:TrmH family RNA methyltransferase [Nitratidesulfovibrio sp. 1201_IL3209]|uniref:TrmH family RNA methyltransferase n=1 Tax=Nitratidesulfovibrio sp. 1201_IL3209 TaxID=3084053 RepID=UPI003FA5B349